MMNARTTGMAGILMILALLITAPEAKAQSNWEIGARFGPEIAVDMTIPWPRPLACVRLFMYTIILPWGPTSTGFLPLKAGPPV
jgi:hypothetical protein